MYKDDAGKWKVKVNPRKNLHDHKALLSDYASFLPTTHPIGKGGLDSISREVSRFTSFNCVNVTDETLDHVITDMMFDYSSFEHIVPPTFEQLMEEHKHEIYSVKKRDSSVGEGWERVGHKFQQFLDNFPCTRGEKAESAFASVCREIEHDVLKFGAWTKYQPTFKVFSKTDGYSQKKHVLRAFRTIQATDIAFQLIMAKYLPALTKCMYKYHRHMISFQLPDWDERIYAIFKNKYTVGMDYQAYDRSISSQLIERLLTRIFKYARIPSNICSYIVHVISNACLILPNGRVVVKWGGNPSGQFWTTVLNSAIHCCYVHELCKRLNIPTDAYELVVTGDDELIGFICRDMALRYATMAPHLIRVMVGTPVSVQLLHMSGTVSPIFPPGIIAPYLDCFTTYLSEYGKAIAVDSRPLRKLKSISTVKAKGVTDDQKVGVYVAMSSMLLTLSEGKIFSRVPVEILRDVLIKEGIPFPNINKVEKLWLGFVYESAMI